MRDWKSINRIMFLILSAFVLFFYFMTFFQVSGFATIVFFAFLLLLLIGLCVEKTKLKHERYTLARELEIIIAVPVSAAVTFFLSINFLGPVIAASLVGLIFTIITKPHKLYNLSNAVYCGAFVGMSSSFFDFFGILFAGFLAGVVYITSHEIYNETGGTLGTIAFIGTFLTKALSKIFGG